MSISLRTATLLLLAVLAMPVKAFAAAAPVVVTVTAKGCEPAEITVPAGEVTFQIVNKSSRAMEWEILSGVMVVDERENIAPGFKQRLVTTLEPGEYIMTCGLLSNPQGKLIVTGTGGPAAPVRPAATDLIGPAAEYRVYLVSEANDLVKGAGTLSSVLHSGDKLKSVATLAAAQSHFERLRPAFGGCDAIAAFVDLSGGLKAELVAGSASPDLADKLKRFEAGARALQGRVASSNFSPADMLKGAGITLNKLASEDPAAPVDRKAAVEGVHKVIDLLQPLLAKADGALDSQLKADFAALDAALNGADPAATNAALKQLAANTAKMTPALGLE